jgi:hypothetical protein
MYYTAGPDLSFCFVGGRAVFLAVQVDRYFCTGPTLGRALQQELLDGRLETGALHSRLKLPPPEVAAPLEQRDISIPSESLYERSADTSRFPQYANAVLRDVISTMALRFFSLSTIIKRLEAHKRRIKRLNRDGQDEVIAESYVFADRLCSSRNRCLARSVALTLHLIGRGYAPSLVIGVRLNPFLAHCWVQNDRIVMTDVVDRVHEFSPILVI